MEFKGGFFDRYECSGILAPGVLLILGAVALLREYRLEWLDGGLSIGALGLLLAAAYPVGHVIQSLGNGIEWLFWLAITHPEVSFLRGRSHAVAAEQRTAFLERLASQIGGSTCRVEGLRDREWRGLMKQASTAIRSNAAHAARLDAFNRSYGANRGFAAAMAVLAGVAVAAGYGWRAPVFLGAASVLCLVRMHRFAEHYVQEVVVQFLAATQFGHTSGAAATKGEDEP